MTVFSETSDHDQTEAALQYQLQLTRTITDNATSCLILLDERGYPTFINPAFERVTGYSLEEIKGRPAHYSVHYKYPDGRPYPMEECPIDRAYPVMELIPYAEEVFVRKDGSLFPVAFSVAPLEHGGRNVGAVVEFRDISGQKQVETALRAATERTSRLQAVTAALSRAATPQEVAQAIITEGYAALGAAGGVVAMLSLDGTQFELVGADGYPPEAIAPWRRFSADEAVPVAEAVRQRQPIFLESQTEAAARYPHLPVLRSSPVVGAFAALPLLIGERPVGSMSLRFVGSRVFAGEERAFVQALADQCALALDRARLYAAEQQARREAEAAVRARDEFLSVAAHELKTPLTSLLGLAQIGLRRMQRDGVLPVGKTEATLQGIAQQGRRLARLVDHLLDISRLETGRLTLDCREVDLARMVADAAALAQVRTNRHTIIVEAPAVMPATVDPLRIEQVLTNLLDNAIKYSPEGGPIWVVIRQPGEGAVQIAVEDRGTGIAPEQRAHIFDRFFQAHTSGHQSGLGLGLYVSRQIMDLHGGRIDAEFPAEGGTRFVVTLPRGAAIQGETSDSGGRCAKG